MRSALIFVWLIFLSVSGIALDFSEGGGGTTIVSGGTPLTGGSASSVVVTDSSGKLTTNSLLGVTSDGVTFSTATTISVSAVDTNVFTLKAAATNDDPQEVVRFVRGTTTDGNATTVWTFDLDADTSYLFEANVLGRRTGGGAGAAGDSASYKVFGAIVDISGTATAVGAGTTTAITLEDQAGWTAVFNVSAGNVLLQVTGAADNNVVWHAIIRIMKVAS